MKNLLKLPIFILYLLVLVACSEDPSTQFQGPVDNGGNTGGGNTGGGNTGGDNTGGGNTGGFPTGNNVYFGFLDGEGSSTTYIDMPVESSPENLLVGRWKIIKIGFDENNDGNIKYSNYADFKHADCGLSFLQFNNRVVFENSYYMTDSGICTLYAETDDWEIVEGNRLKIYVYDNIYIIKVTDTELVLKYDWNFENSLYGPAQVYYYYERILN
ncbi:hypothetical protein [Flavobacterium sp. GT3R68]|uniref:hypothetical protein n=1 Tax=Flavobacterium sp. GT3R68 TaxID=2594437 RepID=UPI000F864574|nr:hypothetical protein [Flavobacterium sp. GT3R68]RTY90628.1 hypothetical protein EKL32_20625 [Flavobacterium sp. GSN2]TRW89846.1 hypothetical protein FNW07_12440 [Flavobacterium sp. GT3R68]